MPGMNRVELARAIRAERPRLPVILVTGYGDLEVLRDLEEWRILQKPYAEDDLAASLGAALNQVELPPLFGTPPRPQ